MVYMNNTESELYIARAMLNAKTAVIADRENREQRIREKAVKAFEERSKPKEKREPMSAEERKAVLTSLKRLNGGKTDDTQV